MMMLLHGLPLWLRGKESAFKAGFNPWVGKIHQRRAWQSTLVFLPGESRGQRSLAGSRGSQIVGHTEAT